VPGAGRGRPAGDDGGLRDDSRRILKHMALVEYGWFSRSLHGREYAPPWDAVNRKADPGWEWRTAAGDSPWGTCRLVAVEQSRADVTEVLDSGDGLGRLARRT
jgi:uncharacterized damage-inducible protein DinB